MDNIEHYFYDCLETRNFWLSFQSWWNTMRNENIIVTKEMAMIGIINEVENVDSLNACLLLARWYIYSEKLKLQSAFLYKFLCRLRYKIKIERVICQNKNQMAQYNKMWHEIEVHLE
jgi:hypothetical protein